jgi:integrase
VNALKVIFRHALENDELTVSPLTNLRLPEAAGNRDRTADPSEVTELLAALDDGDRSLWATAAYAGLRRGELRALRWSDVDLETNVIHVRRGWDDKEGPIDPKSQKSTSRVPIVTALRLHLLEQNARTGRRDDDLVFGTSASTPFTPSGVRRRAKKAWSDVNAERMKEAEEAKSEKVSLLVPIGLHELRHSFVSMLHAAGFTLEEIGDYVGHSAAYMTDRYRHLLAGHEAKAAERFDRYLRTGTA